MYNRFRNRLLPFDDLDFSGADAKPKRDRILVVACSDCCVDRKLAARAASDAVWIYGSSANRVPLPSQHSIADAADFVALAAAGDIRDIVICGHSRCCSLRASLERSPRLWTGATAPSGRLLDRARESCHQAAQMRELAQTQALRQLDRLRAHPRIAARENAGAVTLHAWLYLDETGYVLAHNASQSQFVPFDPVRLFDSRNEKDGR